VGNSIGEEVVIPKNSSRNLHRGDLEFVSEYCIVLPLSSQRMTW